MSTNGFRPISESERQVIGKLLERPFPGRDELREQLLHVNVRRPCNDAWLELEVDQCAKLAMVKYIVPCEGEYECDGVVCHLLLHVRNGRMTVLECYREDGGEVVDLPRPESITVFAVS